MNPLCKQRIILSKKKLYWWILKSMDTWKLTLNKNILSLFPIYLRNHWTLYFLFRASSRQNKKGKKLRKALWCSVWAAQTLNCAFKVEKNLSGKVCKFILKNSYEFRQLKNIRKTCKKKREKRANFCSFFAGRIKGRPISSNVCVYIISMRYLSALRKRRTVNDQEEIIGATTTILFRLKFHQQNILKNEIRFKNFLHTQIKAMSG